MSNNLTSKELQELLMTQKKAKAEACFKKVQALLDKEGCIMYAESYLRPTPAGMTIDARVIIAAKDE